MNIKQISQNVTVFHGRVMPEPGTIVGYSALIVHLNLPVPIPDQLPLISNKHKHYHTDYWHVLTPRHQPKETIYDHLVFALKYEGINLLFFKKLFECLPTETIEKWISDERLSQYARKIWFFYEWLMQQSLKISDLKEGNYVKLIDEDLQFASTTASNSKRHRIKNNLPGNVNFCPLINKTQKISRYIDEDLSAKTGNVIKGLRKDILLRTSAFLLFKDSKASFTIEGETPTQTRAIRWGRAIGQAGSKPLNKEELLRLQQIVIENSRFVKLVYRTEGGFVGEHDRHTGEPIPDHISAKWQDIEQLMSGLLDAATAMEENAYHPVLTATSIAFGFVFIHPFVDGNGRLHRYIMHHLLSKTKYSPQGIIFPISAAILEKIDDYRIVLENYSHNILEFIEWVITPSNNVEVLNNTIDYYRYYNLTQQTEFLFDSIEFTISKIIPDEVNYLQRYDAMKSWLDDHFQMPEKTIALLIRYLEQNNGTLSKRGNENEFAELRDNEIVEIENQFRIIFIDALNN
jgi:Fic family protein